MANREFVKSVVRQQLRKDNPTVLLQAGSQWEKMTMGDFYLAEKQVNSAIVEAMQWAIGYPNANLPEAKWEELRAKINLATAVNTTIDTTTEITAFARPVTIG